MREGGRGMERGREGEKKEEDRKHGGSGQKKEGGWGVVSCAIICRYVLPCLDNQF